MHYKTHYLQNSFSIFNKKVVNLHGKCGKEPVEAFAHNSVHCELAPTDILNYYNTYKVKIVFFD